MNATRTRKTRKSAAPKFENRIRFNWGYHDAAQTVRMSWNNVEYNFGFGPALSVKVPADVLVQHFDSTYAKGWMAGYVDANGGVYKGDSEDAWQTHLAAGNVCE